MTVTTLEPPAPPVGVIESLARGFETVAEHMGLVLLPLLLDLLLWAGPRMSVRPALQSFYEDVWLPTVEQQPAEVQRQFATTNNQFEQLADELPPNYLPVVRWPMGDILLIGVPSFVVRQVVEPLPFDYEPPLWELRSLVGVLGLSLVLPVGWSLFGVAYRGMVAQEVSEKRLRLGELLRHLPVYWLNLIGLMVILGFLAGVVLLPFMMVGLILFPLAQGLGGLAMTAGVFVVMWLGIFASFTTHGVLLNGRRALRAVWDSVRVVQWNLSSTTVLWLLVVGLNLGLSFLFDWAGLTTDSWFVVLAIGVHAFVNTALIAATYVYFKDRYRHWNETRAILAARLSQHLADRAEQFLERPERDVHQE